MKTEFFTDEKNRRRIKDEFTNQELVIEVKPGLEEEVHIGTIRALVMSLVPYLNEQDEYVLYSKPLKAILLARENEPSETK